MKPVIIMFFALMSLPVFATQPHFDETLLEIEKANPEGISVVVFNRSKQLKTVVLKPGMNGNIQFEQRKLRLEPGARRLVELEVKAQERRRALVHLSTEVTGEDQETAQPGYPLYRAYLNKGGEWRRIPVEEAFTLNEERIEGESEPAKLNYGADYAEEIQMSNRAFRTRELPSNVNPQIITETRVRELLEMDPRNLPDLRVKPQEGERRIVFPDPRPIPRPIPNPIPNDLQQDENAAKVPYEKSQKAPFTIRGNFSFRDGGDWVSAWAWVVRVWQKGTFGNWKFLGWDYVAGNGDWRVEIPRNRLNRDRQVRVEYISKNRFVGLHKPSGNVYAWGDNWNWGSRDVKDIGHRFANISGDLPGMNRMYKGASYFWTRFANEGINPLRDEPIRVTFPNSLSTGECQSTDSAGNTIAWSCSQSSQGKIWMIPAHANKTVTQHEIGHSVHYNFWGSFPPGSGGRHVISQCYNDGLAVTEGFANFIPFWIQKGNRETPEVDGFGFNLESLPSSVCTSDRNEARVAATFWDLYDYWNDGSSPNRDTMLFTNEGYTVSRFLSTQKDGMSFFNNVYQGGLSSSWQDRVDQIFKHNTTD